MKRVTFNVVMVMLAILFAAGVSYAVELITITDAVQLGYASILAKVAKDTETWQAWTMNAFKQGEAKTEFNESEIGMQYADDGPKPSQRVRAPIVAYKNDLENGGRFINIRVKNPLMTDPEEILKKGRYHEQTREGAEQSMNRQAVRAPVDQYHLGIKESEIEAGIQYTANMSAAEVMEAFVSTISDHNAQKKDYGMWFGALAGYDMHHYINASLQNNVTSGQPPVKYEEGGIMADMMEHPNTYVWRDGKLHKVSFNVDTKVFEANIMEELEKCDGDDVPTLGLVRAINRIVIDEDMIPASAMLGENTSPFDYFTAYTPGSVLDMLEDDDDYFKLMNAAYQTQVRDNPLMHNMDTKYKSMIIRQSPKLDRPYFDVHSSFNKLGDDGNNHTTDSAFTKTTVSNVEWAEIDLGERSFWDHGSDPTPAAFTAFGADGTKRFKRIVVAGANAFWRANGKGFEMSLRDNTDYKRIQGVGETLFYGQGRVQAHNPVTKAFDKVMQSFQVLTLGQ